MTESKQDSPRRWVRDYLFDVLRDLDIRVIFGVPGTNEIPIIDGTSYPENQVDYIQCLHENIAIGAAMGYARMSGKPGVLVVHVTPGIAHSIGNLFNASRSRIPLVILCCQQQNDLVTQEPLLASNLVDLARQYTKWAHEVRTSAEFPLVIQRAFKEAMAPPNGPVFLSIPWEFLVRAIGPDDRMPGVTRVVPGFTGATAAIEDAAKLLATAQRPIIVAGDGVGSADAWTEIRDLAELLGAPVLCQAFSSVANFPNDDYHWQGELPTSQGGMQLVFKDHDIAFLCGLGCDAQVTVFKHSDGPLIPAQVRQIHLANNTWDLGKNHYAESAILGDIKATLPLLNRRLRELAPAGAAGRNDEIRKLAEWRRVDWDGYIAKARGASQIWAVLIADALRSAIHDLKLERKFVYVHEAVSDPAPFQYLLPFGSMTAAPISYYCVAGGSLGWSMPASLGIKCEAKGCQGVTPELVINAIGDGSSLFYPQAWWTAAHHGLGVLTIVTNNREYHTLQLGLQEVCNVYGDSKGYGWHPRTMDPGYLRLQTPTVDLVRLAKAFGDLEGEKVQAVADVASAVRRGIDYVLQHKKSYVLDIQTAQETLVNPPQAVPAEVSIDGPRTADPHALQPPLNIYHTHKSGLRRGFPSSL